MSQKPHFPSTGAAMALNHKEQSLNGGTERRASRTEVDRCGT